MPTPAPASQPPSPFERLWRILLPTGAALVVAALGLGVIDTSARPAWLFVVGLIVTVIGAASLAVRLVNRGQAKFAEFEQRLDAEIEKVRKP